MKIKISKSQWETIGKTAGWVKTSARTFPASLIVTDNEDGQYAISLEVNLGGQKVSMQIPNNLPVAEPLFDSLKKQIDILNAYKREMDQIRIPSFVIEDKESMNPDKIFKIEEITTEKYQSQWIKFMLAKYGERLEKGLEAYVFGRGGSQSQMLEHISHAIWQHMGKNISLELKQKLKKFHSLVMKMRKNESIKQPEIDEIFNAYNDIMNFKVV